MGTRRRHLGYALDNMASRLYYARRPDEVLPWCEKARDHWQAELRLNPETHTTGRNSDVRSPLPRRSTGRRGQLDRALIAIRASLDAHRRCVGLRPGELKPLEDLAWSYQELGNNLRAGGRIDEALDARRQALEFFDSLKFQENSSLEARTAIRKWRIHYSNQCGLSACQANSWSLASGLYNRVLSEGEQFLAFSPGDLDVQQCWAEAVLQVAVVLAVIEGRGIDEPLLFKATVDVTKLSLASKKNPDGRLVALVTLRARRAVLFAGAGG